MDPNRVIIFDTTLRDGEQSPGISLNAVEKLEIAQQLARLGVDVIEAGFPIASREISRRYSRSRGRCTARSSPAWHGPMRRHRARRGSGSRRRPPAHPHFHLHLGHPHPASAAVHARGRAGPGARGRRPARSLCEDVEF